MLESLCYAISRWMVRSRELGQAGANPSTFNEEGYTAWRREALPRNFLRYFSIQDVQNKNVLDFGCGEGCLSFFVAEQAKSVIGIDANPALIAKAMLQTFNSTHNPTFKVATRLDRVDLLDQSIDVILCFDVMEHVMEYAAILCEWKRILRPNGRALIWWVPWWNPYGPHIESLVPIPWAHVFFSEKTLVRTCARMYDSPDFQPRVWDLDQEGRKKPNKWLTTTSLPEVNRLTLSTFEKTVREAGLKIARREIHGFGAKVAKLTRPLVSIPHFGELFCSFTVYELVESEQN